MPFAKKQEQIKSMKKHPDFKKIFCDLMKLSLIQVFITAMFCGVSFARETTAQELLNRTVTLQMENRKVTEILSGIEKLADVKFTYRTNLLVENQRISVNYKDSKLSDVLEQLFVPLNIKYKIIGRQIVLTPQPVKEPDADQAVIDPLQVPTTDRRIQGTVYDESGEGLPGVSVLVKGTQTGTITDINGAFSIVVPNQESVLVFSFVGYITQEITVGNQSNITLDLEVDQKILEEVVVVGFGTQKKQSVVGAIVQTTNEDLRRTGNVTDLKQALTGQLPGLTTITSSGEPGGTLTGGNATEIFIRGRNTWNGGQPLILVDGVERDMTNVDVSEVESISVLKDASATAVFGVRGANGVILITTKRGTESKPQLSFNYSATALSVSRLPEKLDSYEAIMIRNEMIEREGLLSPVSWGDYVPYEVALRYKKPQSDIDAILYPNVDWEKLCSGISHGHKEQT